MTRFALAPLARVASVATLFGGIAVAQVPEAVPVCSNNGPYVAECTGQQTPVPVTSAGSFDPDGTPITVQWFEECPHGFFDDPTAPDSNMVIDLLGTCSKTCVFELRIFSGGQVTKCNSTVTVQDTTPPVITCPPDFTAIWNGGIPAGQLDTINTGVATASDCDPAPVISYLDISIVPNTMAGQPEVVVTREWTAVDYCDNTSTCIQTLTLLSPSSGLGAILDVAPGACNNELSVSATDGILSMIVLGTAQFDVSQINRSTLQLRRGDNGGQPVNRMISKLADKGRPGQSGQPNCSTSLLDGRADMQLSFSMQQISETLAVGSEAPNTEIDLALTGRMTDGRWFVIRDTVHLVQ